jgi:hypothetical protein
MTATSRLCSRNWRGIMPTTPSAAPSTSRRFAGSRSSSDSFSLSGYRRRNDHERRRRLDLVFAPIVSSREVDGTRLADRDLDVAEFLGVEVEILVAVGILAACGSNHRLMRRAASYGGGRRLGAEFRPVALAVEGLEAVELGNRIKSLCCHTVAASICISNLFDLRNFARGCARGPRPQPVEIPTTYLLWVPGRRGAVAMVITTARVTHRRGCH